MAPDIPSVHKKQALFTILLIIVYVIFLFILVNMFIYSENLVKAIK
jgi:hypothetical protein